MFDGTKWLTRGHREAVLSVVVFVVFTALLLCGAARGTLRFEPGSPLPRPPIADG